MATDRIGNCFIYTEICSPTITYEYPLHLAAHNGRTAKFRRLLAAAGGTIYATNRGPHRCSLLSVALARGHHDIASICLDHLHADLSILDAHFAAIGGPHYAARVWLRQPIVVVTHPEDVQFVRQEGASLLADAELTRQCGTRGQVRGGLVILLRAEAEVLWLTARRCGEDRRLASLVARCAQRDQLLHLMQTDVGGRNVFQVAARRNLHELWLRMYSMFGRYLLTRRDLATSFRLLAEHRPREQRVAHFEELCRQLGGFEAAEIFDSAANNQAHDLLIFEVLNDALQQFNGDAQLFDYLVEVAAHVWQTRTRCSRPEAASAVINWRHPQKRGEHSYTLLEAAFRDADRQLPWLCLQYEPDLLAKSRWYRRGLIYTLLQHGANKDFEATLATLVAKQLAGNWRALRSVFEELCKADLWQAAQLVWSLLPLELQAASEQNERLLRAVLVAGHFETFLGLMELMKPPEPLRVLASSLHLHQDGEQEFPDAVWAKLLAGRPSEWNRMHVSQLLCSALKNRQMPVFDRIWKLVSSTFQAQDACDADHVPILFHAIYDTTVEHRFIRLDRPVAESPELIDSDDDEASCTAKNTLNQARLNPSNEWRPPCAIRNPTLEAAYWRLFLQLIASGADRLTPHPTTGRHLLHVAVERDNLRVARHLLTLSTTNPSAVDCDGNVPMSLVRSAAMVSLLPAADAGHCNRRWTPLQSYLMRVRPHQQDAAVVRALLAASADCNWRYSSTSRTPLLMQPSPAVVDVLLAAGADVNAQDYSGESALWHATRSDQHTELIWRLLRQPGVSVWQRNWQGRSLLAQLLVRVPLLDLAELVPEVGGSEAQLERTFVDRCGGLVELASVQRKLYPDDLRALQRLLELPDLQVDRVDEWTEDSLRFQLECGAHVSQRTDRRPLDWSQCAQPHSICNEIEFLAAAGFDADCRAGGRWPTTALQGYCETQPDWGEQLGIVGRLVAAGADYRKRRADGKRLLLEGTVLGCLYEWDEENGLRWPEMEEGEEWDVDVDGEEDEWDEGD